MGRQLIVSFFLLLQFDFKGQYFAFQIFLITFKGGYYFGIIYFIGNRTDNLELLTVFIHFNRAIFILCSKLAYFHQKCAFIISQILSISTVLANDLILLYIFFIVILPLHLFEVEFLLEFIDFGEASCILIVEKELLFQDHCRNSKIY